MPAGRRAWTAHTSRGCGNNTSPGFFHYMDGTSCRYFVLPQGHFLFTNSLTLVSKQSRDFTKYQARSSNPGQKVHWHRQDSFSTRTVHFSRLVSHCDAHCDMFEIFESWTHNALASCSRAQNEKTPCRCLFILCPRQDSNLDYQLRKLTFYPLNYEGIAW